MQKLLKVENRQYKIKVIEGFGFDENPKKVIFWLLQTTVEDWKLFSEVLKKRIAKEFGCKKEEVHYSYTTGWKE